jgi:hypothetical protein
VYFRARVGRLISLKNRRRRHVILMDRHKEVPP